MKNWILLMLLFWSPFLVFAELERVSPESQGIRSEDVGAYFDSMRNLEKGEAHQIVVLRHGKIVGTFSHRPYDVAQQHTLYSVSKTFVAVAVGIAIEEDLLRLDDRVAQFFPEKIPENSSENLKSMTIRHLLTMSSGIRPDWEMRNRQTDWISFFLKKNVQTPGLEFQYDSMVSYLLSAIVQKVTGKRVVDLLNECVFRPMEINDAEWEESPEGINTGGWGMRMSALSMAKFGQLLLNKGEWNGEQLVSSEWVEEMTKPQISTNKNSTYGYQIWQCGYPAAYRADGAFGQYIIVAPNEDMVFAITQANTGNGIHERNLVWNLLKKATNEPLPESENYHKLCEAESSYQIPTEQGQAVDLKENKLINSIFALDENPMGWQTIQFIPEAEDLQISVTTKAGGYRIHSGQSRWESVETTVFPPYTIKAKGRFVGLKNPFSVWANHAWADQNTLRLHVLYTNWISGFEITFRLNGEKIELEVKENTSRKTILVNGSAKK